MKTDGGPAFPRPASEDRTSGSMSDGDGLVEPQDGMSLRDYFAAKAMQALMTTATETGWPTLAKYAYEVADAMLKARME